MPPASRSRSGESGPGTPSCGQLPAKGVRKIAALRVYAGSMRHTTTAIETTATAATACYEVRRGSVGLPGGHGGERCDGERHRAGPDERSPRRRSCTHHGPRRRRSREARSSASASPAAIPPSRPTKTRICIIRERSLVGVDAGEKTSTPTLEVPPWTAV